MQGKNHHHVATIESKALIYVMTGMRLVYVHLPRHVSCDQCILQWTYTAGNNWGVCANGENIFNHLTDFDTTLCLGTGTLGCGPQVLQISGPHEKRYSVHFRRHSGHAVTSGYCRDNPL